MRHLASVVLRFIAAGLFAGSSGWASVEIRILLDVDRSEATGCSVSGMAGVDRVITTTVDSAANPPRVTSVSSQECSGGLLGAPSIIDNSGWPVSFDPVTGTYVIESRVPLSVFGTSVAPMRLGFVMVSGPLTAMVLTDADGNPIIFPRTVVRRRIAGRPPHRSVTLDGKTDDWAGLPGLVFGGASNGPNTFRILNIFATFSDDAFYFRFDTQSHPDAPTARDDHYTTPAATPINVAPPGVLANDSDPNNRPLSAAMVSPAGRGALVLNSDGSFTYTPDGPGEQRDTFTYRATNGTQPSNIAQVEIGIGRANQAPTAGDDEYNVQRGAVLDIAAPGVLANDNDPDHDTLRAVLRAAPSHGSLTFNADGSFHYVHDGVSASPDTFTYVASDGSLESPEATVLVNVGRSNIPPRANDDNYTVAEGGTLNVPAPGIVTNDSDPDTSLMRVSIRVTQTTAHGTLAVNADGSFTYVHDGGETTSDKFFYRLFDGQAFSNTATVTITITPVNDAPAAVNDNYTVPEDQALSVNAAAGVLANDSDSDSPLASLTAAIVTNAANGGVTLNAGGSFTYTPNANFSGTDTFTYRVSDGLLSSAAATVTITITAVNDPPGFTGGGNVTVSEDSGAYNAPWAASISAGPNETDPLTFTATNDNNALFSAQPGVAPNGTLTFTAAADAYGTATVTVSLSDGSLSTAPVTFTITVTAVNDPPSFTSGGNVSVAEDSGAYTSGWATSISPGPNETDPVGFTLTNDNNALFSVQPALSPAGVLSFTPAANAFGVANVTATLSDGSLTASALFTITVNNVNDPPSFSSGAGVTVNEDSGAYSNLWATAISSGPNETDTLTFNVTNDNNALFAAQPAIAANGTLTFTPAANANGTATVTVSLSDGSLSTAPITFMISVTAVNDPPSFTPGANVTVAEDSGAYSATQATAISAGPPDESAQTVTFNLTNDNNALFAVQPGIDTAGVLTFTPAANAFGTATVSVTANDGVANSATQTFTITVTPVNDAPVVTAGGTLNDTENQAPTAVDTTITILDIDSASLTGATVTISGNYVNGEDLLSFASAFGITGTFDAPSGTLTLTGSASVANYQTALRSVAYSNSSDNPSTAARTVTWQVTDGTTPSNTPASTINVTAVNDPPAINAAAALAYTEGDGTVAIDATTVTVSDVDDTQLSGATVQITANYVNGQDLLGFVNAFGITGSFDAPSGTLTLSGTTTLANYQAALRTVTYTNPSTSPSIAPRTVTWTVSDLAPASGTDTTIINITPINSAPVVTAGGTLSYTENQAATPIDTGLTVTDADTPNLVSGTVRITTNYVQGQDVLSFAPAFGITGTFAAPSGTLTLTGTTTVANWQSALRSVQYSNLSESPSPLSRTVEWQVDDGEPVSNLSSVVTSTINVTAINDAPVNALPVPQNTNEDTPLALIGGNAISLSDVDANPDDVQVTLNVINGTVTLNAGATGALASLTGNGTNTVVATGTVAEINAALNGLTFTPAGNYFGAASIQVVTDDLGNNPSGNLTDTDTLNITVNAVNDAPVLTVTGAPTFNENGAAVNSAASANITDVDDTNIESATIQISANFQSGADVLTFVNTPQITGSFVGGTLTLTGTDTLANYIAALQSVTYANTSENPSTLQRTLTWTVNDGTSSSNTQTTTITVTATNDAPVNTLPGGAPSTGEDIDLGGLVFSIADPDAGTNSIDVQLIVTNGVITLNSIAGMSSYIAGDGTLDAFIHFQGPLSAWNNALNGATFRPSPNFSGLATIQIVTSDQGFSGLGGPLSDDDTLSITVTVVNDAPVLTVTGAASYTENAAPVVIATSANITDADDTNIESATIQITGNYDSGSDVLSYATALGISGSFDVPSGTLTLTGTATLAGYATALQNVKFASTSENPSALQRTVTWRVNDGDVNSNAQITTIDVISVNDPPVINAAAVLGYAEGAGAVAIDGALTVTDPDDAPPTATVQITANYVNGEDILAFTNAFGITGSFDALSGTLTLTGPASPANFQSALRTVTYQNTSNAPSTAPRTVLWTVNDDEPSSGTDTTTINVTATNDAPVLTVTGVLAYTENDAATAMASTANITDADDTNIESATIQITGNYQNGQDVLSYATALGISGVFDAPSGTLTLTGSTTLANYVTALQNVKYNNTSESPSTLARTVTWLVNDGDVNSNAQTTAVNLTSVNDAPVVTPTGTPLSYTENDAATAIQPLITVTDADTTNLTGGTVQLTTNYINGQDVLSYTTALGITGTFNAGTGTLTLSGTTTVANYQTALRNVKYNNTSENPSTLPRTVEWQVNDGQALNNLSIVQTSTINVTAVNDAPVVSPETFEMLGNTELRVDMVAGTTPNTTETTAGISSYEGVLDNETDPEGDTFTVTAIGNGCGDPTAPFDCPLAGGAVVHVDANGEFSYTPAPGATTGSFTYTVTDQPSSGTPQSVAGTVTFTIFDMIWYVKQGGTGTGTSIAPLPDFGGVSELNATGGVGDDDGPGDYIFVHAGSISAASIELEATQHLLGEGVGLSIPRNLNGNGSPTVLVAAGSVPFLSTFGGTVVRITNAVATEVRGLSMQSNVGRAIAFEPSAALTGSPTLTIASNTINGNSVLEGLEINIIAAATGTLNLAIHNNSVRTSSATLAALHVRRFTNPLTITAFHDNNVPGSSTGGILIEGSGAVITFDAVPGGGVDAVPGGTTFVGEPADRIGNAALTLTNVSGTLNFTDLDLYTDAGAALTATGSGAFTLTSTANASTFVANAGPAALISGATVNLQLNSLTSTTSLGGVSLTSVGGTFSAAAGSISKTSGAGTGFAVASSSATVDYAGSLNVTSGAGVSLTSNSGTMTFRGGMTLSTGTSAAFTATGGGTVNVCDESPCNPGATGALVNTLATTTGTALNVASTNIGANKLEFRSISANGAANGIVLNATGTSGQLEVKGSGSAASGGTIQSTVGDAISLTSTKTPSFTFLNVTNTGGHGINATSLTAGLTLTSCQISDTGNGLNEHALRLFDVSGIVSIQGTSFSNTAQEFININTTDGAAANNADTTINVGTVAACTFTQPNTIAAIRAGGAFAGNGILVTQRFSKNYTFNISNSTFTDIKLFGFQFGSSGSTSTATNCNVNLDNNDFLVTITNALGNPNNRANAINIQSFNTLDVDASITNNLLDGGGGGGIQLGADNSASLHANITGNVVSDQFADGILMAVDENATLTVLIDNNQISNTSSDGMEIANAISPGGVSTLNATITNNTVTGHNNNAGANAFVAGIAVFGGVEAADVTNLDIRGNNVSGNPNPGVYFDYFTQGFGDSIAVEGPGTAAVTEAAFLTPGTLGNVSGSPPVGKTFLADVVFNNNTNVPLPVLTP